MALLSSWNSSCLNVAHGPAAGQEDTTGLAPQVDMAADDTMVLDNVRGLLSIGAWGQVPTVTKCQRLTTGRHCIIHVH